MGFLSSIFGKKQKKHNVNVPVAERHEEVSLKLPALPGWLDSQFSKDMQADRERFAGMVQDIISLVKELQHSIYTMRNIGFEEGDRTYAAVNMIKNTWTKKVLMSISSFHRHVNEKAIVAGKIEFPQFNDMLHATVNLINETSMVPKQKLVLSKYFEKENARIADILRSIAENAEEMRAAVSESSVLKAADTVRVMMQKLDEISAEIPSLSNRLEELDERMNNAKKDLSDAESSINALEKSPEWKDMEGLADELKSCAKKKDAIEKSMMVKLGDFKRIMKLFAHDAKRLQKHEINLAEAFSHSPMKAYLSGDASSVQSLFKRLVTCTEAGDFTVSKKDMEKVRRIKKIVDSGWLAIARAQYDDVNERCVAVRRRLGQIKVGVRKREAEREAERLKAELQQIRREKSHLEERINDAEQRVKEKRDSISGYIMREFGRKVKLS